MKHVVQPAVKCASHRLYLLSCEEYNELLDRSENRCEICRDPAEGTPHGVLHIDHDPSRGQGAVRGLLCSRCNTGLSSWLRPTRQAAEWLAKPLFRERSRIPAREQGPVDLRDLDDIDTITREYRSTEADLVAARRDVVQAVIAALRAGARPTDVTARSPFTAAYVRVLAREHGIKPAKRGPRNPG